MGSWLWRETDRVGVKKQNGDFNEATHFSPSTIRARLNRLINQDVVRISAVMTPSIFGLQFMCGFGIRFSPLQESVAISAIEAMPSVSYLSLTLNRWDAVGTLLAKTLADVATQLDAIRSIPGVVEMANWTHLEVIKENYQFTVFKSSASS